MRRDHLAAARIHYVRPQGIFARAGRPANHRIAQVVRVPVRVFLLAGRVSGEDGVLESGRLQRAAPILYRLFEVTAPLGRDLGAQVEHDRLDRLGHRRSGIFLLQPIARDERPAHRAMLAGGVVVERHREISNPRVLAPARHRLLGKQQQVRAKGERGLRWRRIPAVGRFEQFLPVRNPGLIEAELDIGRKCPDAINIGSLRVHARHPVVAHEFEAEAGRNRGREQRRDIDDRRAALALRDHVEGSQHGRESGRFDSDLEIG